LADEAEVETAIQAAVPAIASIVDATDHDAGANPYYQHGHLGSAGIGALN